MPKFIINYNMISEYETTVESDSEDSAWENALGLIVSYSDDKDELNFYIDESSITISPAD